MARARVQGFERDTQLRDSCADFLRKTATIALEVAGRQGFEHAPDERSEPGLALETCRPGQRPEGVGWGFGTILRNWLVTAA
jgi:hypothetical protein